MSRRLLIALLLGCLVLGACTDAPEAALPTPPPTVTSAAGPPPSPAPRPTPEPVRAPEPEPEPEPEPIALLVERLDTELLDNAVLRGAAQRPLDDAVVQQAAEEVRSTLERYLNAQFIAPATRFGPDGLEALLSPGTVAALTEEQRRGLGQLDIAGGRVMAAPARAALLVLVDGTDVLSVTASLTAPLAVLGGERPVDLVQHGSLVLTRGDERWTAEIVDVAIDLSDVVGGGA